MLQIYRNNRIIIIIIVILILLNTGLPTHISNVFDTQLDDILLAKNMERTRLFWEILVLKLKYHNDAFSYIFSFIWF